MRACCLTILLFAVAPLPADILHLRDGRCYRGKVVERTENALTFRVAASGAGSIVYSFDPRDVERLVITHDPDDSATEPEEENRTLAPADRDQILREAFELIDDDDLPAALRALQRAVGRAPDEALAQLDSRSRGDRGQSLAELMARVRLRSALNPRNGRLFHLPHATKYEAAALGRLLETLERRLLDRTYEQRSIEQWCADADAYDELRYDAHAMVKDARLAAAVIGARLRHDPRLSKPSHERREVVRRRAAIADFVAHVSGMQGFTSLAEGTDPAADPALREARRLAEEQEARRRALEMKTDPLKALERAGESGE